MQNMFIVNYTVKSRIITLASKTLWKIQEFDNYNFRPRIYWNFITKVLEIQESEPSFGAIFLPCLYLYSIHPCINRNVLELYFCITVRTLTVILLHYLQLCKFVVICRRRSSLSPQARILRSSSQRVTSECKSRSSGWRMEVQLRWV